MSKKLPTDWIVVTFVAIIGVACLIVSQELKENSVATSIEKVTR